MAEHLGDVLALRRAHVQAAFGTSPEHVFAATRPFVVYEIAKLPFAQSGAVVLAEVAIADDLVGTRAVAAKNGAQRRGRDLRMPRKECIPHGDTRARTKITARKVRMRRP